LFVRQVSQNELQALQPAESAGPRALAGALTEVSMYPKVRQRQPSASASGRMLLWFVRKKPRGLGPVREIPGPETTLDSEICECYTSLQTRTPASNTPLSCHQYFRVRYRNELNRNIYRRCTQAHVHKGLGAIIGERLHACAHLHFAHLKNVTGVASWQWAQTSRAPFLCLVLTGAGGCVCPGNRRGVRVQVIEITVQDSQYVPRIRAVGRAGDINTRLYPVLAGASCYGDATMIWKWRLGDLSGLAFEHFDRAQLCLSRDFVRRICGIPGTAVDESVTHHESSRTCIGTGNLLDHSAVPRADVASCPMRLCRSEPLCLSKVAGCRIRNKCEAREHRCARTLHARTNVLWYARQVRQHD
jgi:hypothetical protein